MTSNDYSKLPLRHGGKDQIELARIENKEIK